MRSTSWPILCIVAVAWSEASLSACSRRSSRCAPTRARHQLTLRCSSETNVGVSDVRPGGET